MIIIQILATPLMRFLFNPFTPELKKYILLTF